MSERFTEERFEPAALAGAPEPVRRYLTHAIAPGAPLHTNVRLTMRGRVKAGGWLRFTATEELDGRSFEWRARVRAGPLAIMRVEDAFRDGIGTTSGKLLGRFPLFDSHDEDIARSAAGRVAVESFWSPASLLPSAGVSWRAESDMLIVATLDVPPERPQVALEIDEQGALKSASTERWGNAGQDHFAYIPCGGTVLAERRFGDLLLPSRVTVSWWFGTPRQAPFFEAEILDAASAA